MKLGVTGSRYWRDVDTLCAVLGAIHEEHGITWLIHGGAMGADSHAELWAHSNNVSSLIYRPNYKVHGTSAPLRRNDEIVAAADLVVAFRANGKSNGTDYTTSKAQEAGKLLRVIREGGE